MSLPKLRAEESQRLLAFRVRGEIEYYILIRETEENMLCYYCQDLSFPLVPIRFHHGICTRFERKFALIYLNEKGEVKYLNHNKNN